MQLRTRSTKDTSDGFGFRCINGNCSKRLTTRSIQGGSFFEKSKVPLAKWLYFLYLWCQDTMVKKAAETTGISEGTIIQVYQYIRDICTSKLLHTPARLGSRVSSYRQTRVSFATRQSTTEVVGPARNSGFLDSPTHQQNQASPICRQWTNVMLTLYQLYKVWYNWGPSYTQTNGEHTTVSRKNFI